MRVERVGAATLVLGDCRQALQKLDLGPFAAVISDPPYGMKLNTDGTRFSGGSGASRSRRGGGRDYGSPIIGDDAPFDPTPWLGYERVVLWGLNHFSHALPPGTALVWVKRNDDAFGSFLSDGEIAWKKGGCGVYCFRDLSIYGEAKTRQHPCAKPVPLMEWCITQAKVPPGGAILDPYAGSGSTLVAAIRKGHPCTGIEIEPRYFEAALRRIEAATRQADLFVEQPAPARAPAASADLFGSAA